MQNPVYPDATFSYFGYDAASNLTEAQDSRGWTYFAYDRTNRLLSDKAPDTSETTHAYDASSNRTRVTSPASSAYYTYNAADRMTQAKSNETDVGSADYGYDAAGNLTAKELGNGAHAYFAYDADNRVTSIKNCLPDGSALAYFQYTYDAAGRITNLTREDDTDVYYTYDNADRLTGEKWQASGGATLYAFTWDYDAVGNRTYESTADAQSYYTYDAANELTKIHELPATGTYFYYDTSGNCEKIQKAGGTTYFQYNDVNLVTEIKYPGDVMNYFSYDAFNSRFAVEESSGVSYFTWDENGMNLLCERDASGSVTAYYTHGYSDIDGIGSLVAAKRNEAGASYYQYPVYDHRGSVVRLLDENGTPTAYFEYDAWGNQLESNVVSGTGTNRFRYQSNWIELKDSGGDLYLSPTRVYHAELGRFLGRDSEMGLAGGYAYARGTPVLVVDNAGEKEQPCCKERTAWFDVITEMEKREAYIRANTPTVARLWKRGEKLDKEVKDVAEKIYAVHRGAKKRWGGGTYFLNSTEKVLVDSYTEEMRGWEKEQKKAWKAVFRAGGRIRTKEEELHQLRRKGLKTLGAYRACVRKHGKIVNLRFGKAWGAHRRDQYLVCVARCEALVLADIALDKIKVKVGTWLLKMVSKKLALKLSKTAIPIYGKISFALSVAEAVGCTIGCTYDKKHKGYLPRWVSTAM